MKYNVNYFIKKFNKIPKNKWLENGSTIEGNKKCALGHCGMTESHKSTIMSEALDDLVFNELELNITDINDGNDHYTKDQFLENHPKSRVLSALKKIKNKAKVFKK